MLMKLHEFLRNRVKMIGLWMMRQGRLLIK